MAERELTRFCARLARDPDDRDARRGVLGVIQRTGHLPDPVARAPAAEVLLARLRQDPGDLLAAEVVLAMVGLRPEVGRVPRWWVEHSRWAGDPTAPRDGRTGLPLWVRRRQVGARMALIPGGHGVRGRWGRPEEEPPHVVELDPFYIDVVPRILDGGLTFAEAEDRARVVGGRLPTEAELERAWRGLEGADHPWGETQPRSGASMVSPFGLVDPPGKCWQWCADFFHPEAYAIGPSRNAWRAEPWDDPAGPRRVVRAALPPSDGPPEPCTRRFGRDPADKDPFLGLRVVFSIGFEPAAMPVPAGPPVVPLPDDEPLVVERRWWEVRREDRSRGRSRSRQEPGDDSPPATPPRQTTPVDPPSGGGGLLGALGRLARGIGQVFQPGVTGRASSGGAPGGGSTRRSTVVSTRVSTSAGTSTRSVTPRSTPSVRTSPFRPGTSGRKKT